MLDFLETARGIKVLYEYVSEEILEKDFFEFLASDYNKLLEADRELKWYVVNPEKLRQHYAADPAAFVVDEYEKYLIMRAIAFIKHVSVKLPEETSFGKRLEYAKAFVPSCLYSKKEKTARILDFSRHFDLLLNRKE